MAYSLPPVPTSKSLNDFAWGEWFNQLRNFLNSITTYSWSVINFTGSKLTDIVSRPHSDLQSIVGSSDGYHLSAAQYSTVVNFTTNVTQAIQTTTQTEQVTQLVPITGFTTTVSNTTNILVLEPTGTLATGTITMPASPVDGQVVRIVSTQIVTALTHNPNTGQTLKAPLTTIGANGFGSWVWKQSTSSWYRTG